MNFKTLGNDSSKLLLKIRLTNNEMKKKYARTEETRKDCLEGKVPEKQPQQIVNLINNCDYGEIQTMLDSGNNYLDIKEQLDESQIKRCPYAWYKLIDYETGTLDLTTTRVVTDASSSSKTVGSKSSQGGRRKKTRRRKSRRKSRRKKRRKSRRKSRRKKRRKKRRKRNTRNTRKK